MAPKKKQVEQDTDTSIIVEALNKIGAKIYNKIEELKPNFFLKTGILSLDHILSDDGGIPSASCIEMFGPAGCGKSSLALQIIPEAKKIGLNVFYINAERSISDSLVKCFPIKDNDVVWIEPDNGEAAINSMIHILSTVPNSFVINDSIPACLPSQIEEGNAGDHTVGALARLFADFMPKAKKLCKLNNSILLQLNQERAKIGMMAKGKEQPGGYSVKFYSDIRIELNKRYPAPEIKSGQNIVGHYISMKLLKSRYKPPFVSIDLPLIYGQGISTERELIDLAISLNIVKQAGAWFSFEHIKVQGIESLAEELKKSDNLKNQIKEKITEIIK